MDLNVDYFTVILHTLLDFKCDYTPFIAFLSARNTCTLYSGFLAHIIHAVPIMHSGPSQSFFASHLRVSSSLFALLIRPSSPILFIRL